MGRPIKSDTNKCTCTRCGRELNQKYFYHNNSEIYKFNDGLITVCKDCIKELYQYYYNLYDSETTTNKINVERKATKRICMMFNFYYSDKVFDEAWNHKNKTPLVIATYIRQIAMVQYANKTYDTTLNEQIENSLNAGITIVDDEEIEDKNIDEEIIKRFGKGFSKADYIFLQEQYEDWTTRHECQTKSQEENFKAICFNRLNAYKANLAGEDTKDLDKTFKELLDVGKLQPKQNAADTISQAQTFGTLIEKYENTRPLPEIDEELKDVDNIGLYLDTFFKGHLAKMMGLKNGLSKLYEKVMKKYTVTKPEFDDEEDSEVLFDAIFGNKDLSDD